MPDEGRLLYVHPASVGAILCWVQHVKIIAAIGLIPDLILIFVEQNNKDKAVGLQTKKRLRVITL